MNILIIEDDKNLARSISESFMRYEFSNRTHIINSYDDFLNLSWLTYYDMILLDINLDSSCENKGIQILECIRKRNMNIPIIMISGHNEYSYLEEAFKKGAHDYIIKPFRNRELHIRAKRWFVNYLLTLNFKKSMILRYHKLSYSVSWNEFFVDKEIIPLTKSNKYILLLLLIHKEKLLDRDFLVWKIWWVSDYDSNQNLRIKIMRLKKQMSKVWISSWLWTIRWEWYKLKKVWD